MKMKNIIWMAVAIVLLGMIWSAMRKREAKSQAQKPVVGMLSGRSLSDVIAVASAGDMNSIRALTIYYALNDPDRDPHDVTYINEQSYYWTKKGADLGDEYMQKTLEILNETKALKLVEGTVGTYTSKHLIVRYEE
jgi:hypothetical protein